MTDDLNESKKGMNAGAQAVAAVVLVGGVLGGMWGLGEVFDRATVSGDRGPAACSKSHGFVSAKHVSGARLCTALNRHDLPELLGTPTEYARTADGNEGSVTMASGTKIAAPEATVTLDTYSVKLSASEDRLPVAELADFLGATTQKTTILGHPAALYSSRTIEFTFNGSKVGTGPGGIARSLLVARTPKDGGGSFEIAIWRQDDVMPDDTALLRVAETVLPTVPGWTAD
ncbi:DUF6215 domain-containing protein [Streptomyces sp. NPDC001982]|uniref:DUF6215 domain-containing protein n=1 Tax=Streptomyces sp. NPDC001982 TaxID=3154405 RepID=UPI0033173ADD